MDANPFGISAWVGVMMLQPFESGIYLLVISGCLLLGSVAIAIVDDKVMRQRQARQQTAGD